MVCQIKVKNCLRGRGREVKTRCKGTKARSVKMNRKKMIRERLESERLVTK